MRWYLPCVRLWGHMGSSAGTVGVAGTGEEKDAALLVSLVKHGLWDIWEEEAVFLDDCFAELFVDIREE